MSALKRSRGKVVQRYGDWRQHQGAMLIERPTCVFMTRDGQKVVVKCDEVDSVWTDETAMQTGQARMEGCK